VRLWTEVICLRIQADGGIPHAINRTTRFHKRQDMPCLAETLLLQDSSPRSYVRNFTHLFRLSRS